MTLFCIMLGVAAVGALRQLAEREEQRTTELGKGYWQAYQDHRTRVALSQLAADLLKAKGLNDAKWDDNLKREEERSKEMMEGGRENDTAAEVATGRGWRLRIGQFLFELALALATLALFKMSKVISRAAGACALLGALIAASGLQ